MKYAHVPFKEQTQSPPVEEKPAEQRQNEQETASVQSSQEQQPSPEDGSNLSEWRTDINAKFQERIKADEKVDHSAPREQSNGSHQISLLTEKPRQQEKPAEETNYRLQLVNGEISFDEWRSKIKEKLHNEIVNEKAKNAPQLSPKVSPAEVKERVSQKMDEVEQAQNAVLNGERTDLESISSLQKELSELLALMGGGG